MELKKKTEKSMIKLFFVAGILLFANLAFSKTASELLASGSAEEKGIAIAEEFEARDIGWGDVKVDIDMVLIQSDGKKTERSQRIMILQKPDRNEGDKSLITFDSPADVKGTGLLSHAKILEADDQWLFLPALKRVKRISSNNKSGPFVGSEFAYEDITSNEIGKYSWKYLETVPCDNFKCFKLETIPLYEHSGYSKRIVFIDSDHFRLQKIEFYDRKGDLLKTQTYSGYKQYLGKFWRADSWKVENKQNGKSTILNFRNYRFKNGLTDKDFTQAVLNRVK